MFESLKVTGSIILENKPFVLWVEQVHRHSLEKRNSMLIILAFSEQGPRKGQRKTIKVGQQTLPKVVILCPSDHSKPESDTASFETSPVTSQSVFMTRPLNLYGILFMYLCSITHKT